MKNKLNYYFLSPGKGFYFIAIASYTICLLFFLPDNVKYTRKGIILIDVISSAFVYTTLILYLSKRITFKLTVLIYVYSALLNIIFSSWYYFFHLQYYTDIFLICTSIYCINLAVGGLCIGYKHAYLAAFLYIGTLSPLMIFSDDQFLHRYWAIICIIMTAFAIGISGFLFLLEKAYNRELQLMEQINEKNKATAEIKENLLNGKLEIRQKENMLKTMFLAEKAENNNKFIQELIIFKQSLKTHEQQQLEKLISSHKLNNREHYWKDFEACFLEVNSEFYKNLRNISYDLSPAELKLASLIFLGLSSKQISNLCNCTIESIEVARSRLRHKLGVPTGACLKSFLSKL